MNKIRPLTLKQKEIFNFVVSYNSQYGYSPSLEEIANKFGKAISTIHKHISLISNKGLFEKDSFQPRGISLVDKLDNTKTIPLLGIITAGKPIEPIENSEPIEIPRDMIKDSVDYYALKVRGESMIEEGIWDGDVILIRHQNKALVGDTVVAVTDGEATLKKFGGRIGDKVKLIPRNPKMLPFEVDVNSFEIRGKFVGLIRRE